MNHPPSETRHEPDDRTLPDERSLLVNGEPHPLPEAGSVLALVEQLGLAGRKIAVSVDRVVVPRSRLSEHRLRGGEHIEILEAVGGG